ncbi:sugar ABC transporter substrate-binding protein [Erwinia sp. OLTSP20]|uniref:substrate-binding domain-containing protein n=1 Tax=unclassified Erwinia TaxID=2622719 RepID=UPI000C1A3044|nr:MULTISPECIES: substrate-binding domain-containing protein [unclassified Erwinia]PIJ50140.1 sugar ABC transporter substrate-binding protein [Erwinia sp. OAMSP11]PIJ71906.1 sugar ABC transporter substrate-binding protein [Erwinia sp. OLSSP12]PIJ81108.1 sugar ABC transporter substrate-binding protein [Erwinia sp. OLCASP19]PIJ83538.1 sugar ABC transporter substrate-binding protein [Erwinia sp. OLMTSP26]PIJ86153.1 sugar ABC transporter substrate-binding protein [Erwinia sp. OLMDSP33]
MNGLSLSKKKTASLRLTCFIASVMFSALISSPAKSAEDRLVGLIPPLKADKPFKLAVTVVHLNDDFYKGIIYGITDEAKRTGVNVVQVSVAGAYGNVREQFAQLEAFKSIGADVAVLAPAAFNGFDPIIKSLKAGGMKVASVGIPVNSKNIDFGVLQDDSYIGKLMADAVCKAAAKPKKVAMIPGPAGAEWVRLRYEGFKAEAQKCATPIAVIDSAFGGGIELQEGLSKASDLMLRNPDVNFIYTPQITLGMGAVQAIRQQHREATVVSSAMVKRAVPMIEEGKMLAVVSEPGILMGRLIVQYAIREMEHKPLPNLLPAGSDGLSYAHYNVPNKVLEKDNVATHPFETYEIAPADWKVPAMQ